MSKIPGRFYVWQIVIGVTALAGLALSYRGWQWDSVRSEIRRAHPHQRQIEPAKLAAWIKDPGDPRPIVLDVRPREQFDLSHIPGARWIALDTAPAALDLPGGIDNPLIVYCATGRQSADFAERLETAGYTHVSVLDGGLFRWANEDHILTGAHGPATTVHPESESVSHLLKRERRAETSP